MKGKALVRGLGAGSAASVPGLRLLTLSGCTERRAPVQRSRVGQKLSELTTSRVVLLVLGMLFILPVCMIGGGIYGSYPDLGVDGLDVSHPNSTRFRVNTQSCTYFLSATRGLVVNFHPVGMSCVGREAESLQSVGHVASVLRYGS